MVAPWLVLVLPAALVASVPPLPPSNSSAGEEKTQRSLLSIVRFQNYPCFGDTLLLSGTCVTKQQCISHNGIYNGYCALGFGICCTVVRASCGTVSALNMTYFRSLTSGLPDQTPSAIPIPGTCQLTVIKLNRDIGQIRLDFNTFVLNAPDAMTICATDTFTVATGSSSQVVPTICGTNTGQHMYIHLGPATTQVYLTVTTTNPMGAAAPPTAADNRQWDILVSQIPRQSFSAAPDGCLQYFMGSSGGFSSFNWVSMNAGRMISNQNYAICVRTEAGFCTICLSQCEDPPSGFGLSTAMDLGDNDGTMGANCETAYLEIPCGLAMNMVGQACTADRFCGGTLQPTLAAQTAEPMPVCTLMRPFVFRFRTAALQDTNTIMSQGFCINYNQSPCAAASI